MMFTVPPPLELPDEVIVYAFIVAGLVTTAYFLYNLYNLMAAHKDLRRLEEIGRELDQLYASGDVTWDDIECIARKIEELEGKHGKCQGRMGPAR